MGDATPSWQGWHGWHPEFSATEAGFAVGELEVGWMPIWVATNHLEYSTDIEAVWLDAQFSNPAHRPWDLNLGGQYIKESYGARVLTVCTIHTALSIQHFTRPSTLSALQDSLNSWRQLCCLGRLKGSRTAQPGTSLDGTMVWDTKTAAWAAKDNAVCIFLCITC